MLVRRGNTLPEVVVSAVLVGIVMTAALRSSAQVLVARRYLADEAFGQKLAAGLIDEIMQQAYSEPGAPDTSLGPESDEIGMHRTRFDDVDDYHGLVENPVTSRDGASLAGTEWMRSSHVVWIDGATLTPSAAKTSIKKITVTVTFAGRPVSLVSTFKTTAP